MRADQTFARPVARMYGIDDANYNRTTNSLWIFCSYLFEGSATKSFLCSDKLLYPSHRIVNLILNILYLIYNTKFALCMHSIETCACVRVWVCVVYAWINGLK